MIVEKRFINRIRQYKDASSQTLKYLHITQAPAVGLELRTGHSQEIIGVT